MKQMDAKKEKRILQQAKPLLKKAGHDLYNFTYIVGIQTVRILKRAYRKTAHFLLPFTVFCKSVYRKTLGKVLKNIRTEFHSIREGFSIARRRIFEAKQQGFGKAIMESFRVTGRSFVRHKKFVCSTLNIVAPIVAVIALTATIGHWNSLNYGLVLNYGGEEIAVIEDEKVFEQATEMVSQRMVHDTSSDNSVSMDMTPTFKLAVVEGNYYAEPSVVCDKIIQQSNGIIEEASGLYVDGQLLGAVKSSADLRYMLQELLDAAKGDDTSAKAEFIQDVETINGLFPTTSIMTTDAMSELVNSTAQETVLYTAKSGDTPITIAQANGLTLEQLEQLNPGLLTGSLYVGSTVKVQAAVPKLGVQLIKQETYTKPIAYKTTTEKDSSKYTDYSKVKVEGQNGEQTLVDEVVYVNGVETKRTNISTTVTKEPVNKIVVTGTKKRTNAYGGSYVSGDGKTTGSLMWPVPSLRTITTYYGYRWGAFHAAIDISGGSAYGKPIVAADGGTVVAAGYDGSYGYRVKIQHSNGISTLYAHASKLLVRTGQKVSKGQTIALVGSTGNSTGPHLHFEVYVNGSRVNPLNYVS